MGWPDIFLWLGEGFDVFLNPHLNHPLGQMILSNKMLSKKNNLQMNIKVWTQIYVVKNM